jgi:hypothetical protein
MSSVEAVRVSENSVLAADQMKGDIATWTTNYPLALTLIGQANGREKDRANGEEMRRRNCPYPGRSVFYLSVLLRRSIHPGLGSVIR